MKENGSNQILKLKNKIEHRIKKELNRKKLMLPTYITLDHIGALTIFSG
jgi:hypothetical protein